MTPHLRTPVQHPFVGRALLLCLAAFGAPDAASLPQPAASSARPHRLHIGWFDCRTASARAIAPAISEYVLRSASSRTDLSVTADVSALWLDPLRATHHGSLLRCMNPWHPRKEVLTCVENLEFPPPAPPVPPDVEFLLEAELYPSEQGIIVSLQLFPIVDGAPGPLLMIRDGVVPPRGRRVKREKVLSQLLGPLLDMAAGLPPRRAGERPAPPPPPPPPPPPAGEPMESH